MKNSLIISTLVATLALPAGFAFSADQEQQVYGSQLMTQQERDEHRIKMRSAETAEERAQVRKEHHEKMKERAKARGMTLPDEPPARGGGVNQGSGMGLGPGQNP